MPRLFSPHVQCAIVQSRSIWIKTNSGSGLIRIGSGLDKCAFSVNMLGQMRIQCGHAQTGFNPAQYTLGVQCGQAFSLILREKEIW